MTHDAAPPARRPSLRNPDDFFVEEIPLYEPKGAGDHCFIWIEKVGLSTPEAIRRIARALGAPEKGIGHAGLKDAAATTRQYLSVPGLLPSMAESLSVPGVTILRAERHDRRLRTGHLRGNRFRLRLPTDLDLPTGALEDRLRPLVEDGLPNAYGIQRFGAGGQNADLGRALVQRDADRFVSTLLEKGAGHEPPDAQEARECARRGDHEGAARLFPAFLHSERAVARALAAEAEPELALRKVPRRFRQLYLSAYQSLLFNRVLEQRLADLHRLHVGDLAFLHRNGACFRVEDPETDAPRLRSFEISVSGPIFGYKMIRPEGPAREMEDGVLEEERLLLEDFRLGGGLSQKGDRRSMRARVEDARVTEEGGRGVLEFSLPKGSYATTLLGALGLPSG